MVIPNGNATALVVTDNRARFSIMHLPSFPEHRARFRSKEAFLDSLRTTNKHGNEATTIGGPGWPNKEYDYRGL